MVLQVICTKTFIFADLVGGGWDPKIDLMWDIFYFVSDLDKSAFVIDFIEILLEKLLFFGQLLYMKVEAFYLILTVVRCV